MHVQHVGLRRYDPAWRSLSFSRLLTRPTSTDEHNIQKDAAPQQHTHRRPDLSTFFSTLELVDTSSSTNQPHNNANADPIPANVSSAYRQLANSYQIIMGESEGVYTPEGQERERSSNALLENMVSLLMQGANDPPTRPHGMPEEYFDRKSPMGPQRGILY